MDSYIHKGQIEILDSSEWYTKSGKFEADKVLEGWVEKESGATKRGFDGLRLTGNTFWLEERDWREFTEYEEAINNAIGKYRMVAICSYALGKCEAPEIMDVVSNHQFALIKREDTWETIENPDRKRAEEEMREKTHLNQILLDALPCEALLLRANREVVISNQPGRNVGAVPGKKCFATWGQRDDPCPWCLAPTAF